MNKKIKDGKVAVLVSPGYGAGWYSWHKDKELLFSPVLVDLVENNRHDQIDLLLFSRIFEGKEPPYLGGVDQLVVEWVPVGTQFLIDEYDGDETLIPLDNLDIITA